MNGKIAPILIRRSDRRTLKVMRAAFLLLLLALGSCARPQHPSPYVPPETQYSYGSTLMAAGGLMAAAMGASFSQDPDASKTMKTAASTRRSFRRRE